MVVAIHRRALGSGQLAQQTAVKNSYPVRVAFTWRSLLMFDSVGNLTRNILNQRAAAKYVQRLNTKTDGENRKRPPLSLGQRHQIGFVFFGDHVTQLRMGLLTVASRLNVRITSRQEQAIQSRHYAGDV